ncbi:MAG: transglycosylase SLT domain-containing protein [Pyrinomonadaceae bacterium]|nr:transglycosylase SLT domain-containing protein [Pyrinomonadaceae bacterium]
MFGSISPGKTSTAGRIKTSDKNAMIHLVVKPAISIFLVMAAFSIGCRAQTEDQALASLRAMTSSGKLPAESAVAAIETRFANKRTGALARLLRARIRLEGGDAEGAAAILDSDVFRKRTKLADHALWLRGKALSQAGKHAEAMAVLGELIKHHGDSVRLRDAKLLWASSAVAAGRAVEAPPMLVELSERNDGDALLETAKAYEAQGSQDEAIRYYRRTYFFAAGSAAASEAEAKLTSLSQPLVPQAADEQLARADKLLNAKAFSDAAVAYNDLASRFESAVTPEIQVRRLTALAQAGKMADARSAFNSLPVSAAKEREAAYRELVLGYAQARQWPTMRSTVDAMRAAFPDGTLVPKTLIDAGLAARDAKSRADEGYLLNLAHTAYPNAIEVAQAQFEAAWFQHEQGDLALSSQMFIDHLARYVDKDNTNRGKAGYWAARDSERADKFQEACALYDGVIYRYSANWWGYLAAQRMAVMRSQRRCSSTYAPNPTVARAVANLKIVTVAAETAREHELDRAAKSDELSIVGLFDWAIDELTEAKRSAGNSPSINMALARHYRWKGDNVKAFLALRTSYPDYAQMFPEEMGREEWEIFYPLVNWAEIKYWAGQRGLDAYQVAGLIRQESVFDPRAKSPANAYGLMQLLVPTANTMAKKYISKTSLVTPTALYQAPLNIELGTAYLKDQFAKFGRIEYVAVAYNAGPGRVAPWRASLPADIDEFVEAIPFKETKGYVQGVIRNTAQYRRLYDENGNFKPNVGSKPLRSSIDSLPRDQFVAANPEIAIDDAN